MERRLPNSDWCYVCGENNPLGHHVVFRTDGERVRTRYKPEVHRQGYPGVVHGGVLCTILDETMGWAASLKSDRLFVTGELTVRFLRPMPAETEMIIEGFAESVTKRLAHVTGEVRDENGVVYATAAGKYLPLSAEKTKEVDDRLIYRPDTVSLFGRKG
jgi:uncharacterized protein (TIGR00369 family)